MIKKSLKDIQGMVCGSELNEKFYNIEINGVSKDTRTILKNQLYIPIKGESFDGHNFLNSAIENGAVATLWNRDTEIPNIDFPFILVDDTLIALQNLARSYRESLSTIVIGITGSNGKTSTKDILASLLKTKYKTHKTEGNYNNHIGLPLTILNMDSDTEYAVIEMGISDFKEMTLLSSIAQPNYGLITNIGEVHIEDLKTPANIAKAKMEFLDNFNENNIYFYFGDDPTLTESRKNIDGNFEILTYGLEENNDYIIKDVEFLNDGCSFSIDSHKYFIPLIGRHQVYNGAAAITIAKKLGLSNENIDLGLKNIDSTGLRNEIIKGENFTILNDSYKSNLESALASLDTLYFLDGYRQKIVVFGDMLGLGEKAIEMHKELGLAITNEVDYLFTIGELSKNIASEAIKTIGEDKVFSFDTKENIYKEIKKVIKDDSIILIKASRFFELETIADELINK